MDVEARKKYCGLLMFPSGPPSSRNNDIMSMREVDSSPSTFESSRNMMNNSLDHQFVMQNGFGEYSASSRALAAGAAAGGDFINQDDMDTPNMIDGDTSAKSQPAKRTPRPPNAFILYRRAKQPAIIASQRNLTNAEVSRTISDMWKKEPEEIRLEWERFADRKKLEHMQTYPNYVYRPNKNKNKSKVDKRRQQRRQTASKDSPNSSNNNNNNLVENISSTNQGGPVRRKSTKSVSSKPPTKLDLPLPINGMTGYMQQQQQNMNQQTNTDTSNSFTTILPSPEIPLMSTHFTENPEEFVSHPVTPITPLTPPEHDYKVQSHLLQELTYQQQHHQNQGNTPQFSFQSIPLTSFPNAPNPLEFCCFVPDVEQQQQQMIAEMMLHHEQHHHITPTATVPSSNPASTVQYYSSGGGSFTEMLGFEFPFLGGSVNHNGNGLDSSDQYLQ